MNVLMKVNSQIVLGILAKYIWNVYILYILYYDRGRFCFLVSYNLRWSRGNRKMDNITKNTRISSRHKIVDNLISKIFLRIFIYHVDQKKLLGSITIFPDDPSRNWKMKWFLSPGDLDKRKMHFVLNQIYKLLSGVVHILYVGR